jgi:hypothetical protein
MANIAGFSNVVLNFPDQGVKTKVIIDPSLPTTRSAAIYGTSSPQTMSNKTITDSTNIVAASMLRNGTNLATLGPAAPTAGQVLAATGPNTLEWTAGSFPFASVVIYVDENGSDATGDGTAGAPYRSISQAMAAITDASLENRYAIAVSPGNFPENFSIKANVTVVGTANISYITGAIDINDPSWNDPGGALQNQSGFKDCVLIGQMDFDYSAQQSGAGSLNFIQSVFVSSPVFTGYIGNNQNRFLNGTVISNIFSAGCADTWGNTAFFGGGTYFLTSSAGGNTSAMLLGGGGGVISAVYSAGANTVSATLLSFVTLGSIIVDGASASVSATSDCIQSAPTVGGGASFVLLTPAFSVGYTPTTPANWNVQPTSTQEALDMLAAKVGPV